MRIGGHLVKRGTRQTIDLELPSLYTHTPITMPVHVWRGRREGPTLLVSAALHGDEINGVEVIRRLLQSRALNALKGTLIAIPIINVYGVLHQTRYLPDRRDLNRSFPGSEKGSLTARVADVLMTEIVSQCSHGIDLHTGAIHRANLPQIRAKLDDPETADLANVFGVPVVLNANLRDGSLRQAAADGGVRMLLYEAGEALRFDETSIRAGVKGVLNVMRHLKMLRRSRKKQAPAPYVARSSTWVRAPRSGILIGPALLGAEVAKDQTIATIGDPFSDLTSSVVAHADGVVIGRTNLPLIHEGDALFHIARLEEPGEAASQVEAFHADYLD